MQDPVKGLTHLVYEINLGLFDYLRRENTGENSRDPKNATEFQIQKFEFAETHVG